MAKLNTEVPTLQLKDGPAIPMLGYGTGTAMYKRENDGKIDRERVEQIKTAIKVGYTHLDGAEVYNTEGELGTAIKESKVPREKLFVTTKVLPNISDIPKALDASLGKLKLDYVDLYLIHAPWLPNASGDADNISKLQEAWKAMEQVKAAGKAKAIGVSNFTKPHLETVLEIATDPPVLNQIEYHLYLQHGDLLDFHKQHGIVTAAYAPITPVTKAKPGPVDDLLESLAKKYFVNPGDICLRFCLEKGVVAVTTSSKEQRLSDYMRITAFKMTPKEVGDLEKMGLEKHFRGFWNHKIDVNDKS